MNLFKTIRLSAKEALTIFASQSRLKMSSKTLTIDELKQKSAQSSALIDALQKKIEQIKLECTPVFMAEKADKLKIENEQLKAEIEKLKKELSAQLDKKGVQGAKTNGAAESKKEEKATGEDHKTDKKANKQQETKKPQAKKEEALKPEDVNISKLDIRVGKIVEVKKHPEADLLYVEQIDLGEGKTRTVCSGLVKYIPIEKMQDKLVVCVCNLKPAKLKGVLSEAMVLCASSPECVELIEVPHGAQVGDRVTAKGFEGEPAAECTPKNNIFGLVCPNLKTNDGMVATYKDVPLEISGKGPLKSVTLKGAPVK